MLRANAKYGAAMVEASGPSASAPSVTSAVGAAAVAAAAASNNPVADALERKWSGAAPGTASGMAGAEGRTVTERIDALTGELVVDVNDWARGGSGRRFLAKVGKGEETGLVLGIN